MLGNARLNLWQAIRNAKKKWWNKFLQEVKRGKVWMAANYTAPRFDRTDRNW